jgi:predicted ATPase
MKLVGENIGRFQNFSIELNGLTVIAGINGTGKSTIGKSLYTAVKGAKYLSNELTIEKLNAAMRIISDLLDFFLPDRIFMHEDGIDEDIIEKKTQEEKDVVRILLELNKKIENLQFDSLADVPSQIQVLLTRSIVKNAWNEIKHTDDDTILQFSELWKTQATDSHSIINRTLLSRIFVSEFQRQVHNIFTNIDCSSIELFDDTETSIRIDLKNNECTDYRYASVSPYNSIIYIDSQPLIDASPNRVGYFSRLMTSRYNTLYSFKNDHSQDCQRLIRSQELVARDILEEMKIEHTLSEFNDTIRTLLDGEFSYSKKRREYVFIRNEKEVYVNNTATGTKAFGVIEILLQKGLISPGTCLILDEPESHLHPEWQIKYAELLVRFIEKLPRMNILVNSHSPFFIEAIQQYSKKYNVNERCNYYYVEKHDFESSIIDVTPDISIIYDSLANPYKELDKIFEQTNYDN